MELDPPKRSKRPNFSDSETTVLLEEIAFEYTTFISKFQTSVTIAQKAERAVPTKMEIPVPYSVIG